MEINPYQNGIHSLAEGLRNLNSFLENGSNPYEMKEVIIKVHHGLETLFKDILFQQNPIFLLDNNTTVKKALDYYQAFIEKKNNYLFDEAFTITPTEAIKRINTLQINQGMSTREFSQLTESFDNLNALRNKLQHFELKANPDIIIRTLGNLVPRAITLIQQCYTQDIASFQPFEAGLLIRNTPDPKKQFLRKIKDINADLDKIYNESTSVISMLESKYDKLIHQAIERFKKTIFKNINQSIKIKHIVMNDEDNDNSYMPKFLLSGWMNENLDSYYSTGEYLKKSNGKLGAIYEAKLKLKKPTIKQKAKYPHYENQLCEFSIAGESNISILNPETFFNIPECNEHIPFLRFTKIKIQIQLTCEVDALFNSRNFLSETNRSISGQIVIEMTSSIFGDQPENPSIKGIQIIDLNIENTSVQLEGYVENNELSDNYAALITIKDCQDIKFK